MAVMMNMKQQNEILLKLLECLHVSTDVKDIASVVINSIKKHTDIEAVGIRLKNADDDFPYFETKGFPSYFIQMENSLCAFDSAGNVIKDGKGRPDLECMCGNVICRRTNADFDFFTEHGSFWSNNTTKLLASTTEKERQAKTRNKCNGEGYESVALIPLVAEPDNVGLLQLNDHRTNMFTIELIEFFEKIGVSIGISLRQMQTFQSLEEEILVRKKSEKELVKAKEAAEAANRVKSEFLANMSHEIRTPMNAVLGFAEILKGKEQDSQKSHYIDSIHSSGRALLSLINDILHFSKIEAGKLKIQYPVVSIQALF